MAIIGDPIRTWELPAPIDVPSEVEVSEPEVKKPIKEPVPAGK